MRPQVYSSGFLLFRREVKLEFLLMRHPRRWDLPKGHLDFGETKVQAALRELHEETGIPESSVWKDPEFEFVSRYDVQYGRDSQIKAKELTIYLGFLREHFDVVPTEHNGFDWVEWNPPHLIQKETIDPLLAAINDFFASRPLWPAISSR